MATQPQTGGIPQGNTGGGITPPNATTQNIPKSSPLPDGPIDSLVEQSPGGNPLNKDGFVGVDPQFQQYSTDVDKPL